MATFTRSPPGGGSISVTETGWKNIYAGFPSLEPYGHYENKYTATVSAASEWKITQVKIVRDHYSQGIETAYAIVGVGHSASIGKSKAEISTSGDSATLSCVDEKREPSDGTIIDGHVYTDFTIYFERDKVYTNLIFRVSNGQIVRNASGVILRDSPPF